MNGKSNSESRVLAFARQGFVEIQNLPRGNRKQYVGRIIADKEGKNGLCAWF